MPANLESIGGYAFEGCTSLEQLSIPESCTQIGEYAFENCTKLTKITSESKNKLVLYGYTFYGCIALEEVYLPNVGITAYNTTWYGRNFGGCKNLQKVQLGSKNNPLTELSVWAFNECSRNDLIIKI